jgi:hypothetical protein
VLRLGVLCLYRELRLAEAVGVILHERFNSDDDHHQPSSQILAAADDDEVEGVQSLEKKTWLRWLWFILGTLPPTIKLLAMRGVHWEQAWGMMFLSSWIINESLIIFAAMNQSFFTFSPNGRISWPGFEQTSLSAWYQNARLTTPKCQRWLAFAAMSCHGVILNGVFRVIFRGWWTGTLSSTKASTSFQGRLIEVDPYHSRAVSVGPVIVTSLGMMGGLAFLYSMHFLLQTSRSPFTANSIIALPIITTWLLLVSIVVNSSTYSHIETTMASTLAANSTNYLSSANTSSSAQYVYVASTLVPLAIVCFVQFLGRRLVMLGKNLLVTYPDAIEGAAKIDHGAVLSVDFFLATIFACVLWYGYVFDPAGTSNPSWTGVFG